MIVYLLQHTAERQDGEDVKIIGIYSSLELAEKAKSAISETSGFKDYPDGFYIDPYNLDKTFWESGF
ncbi:DUF7336 domain-containing protein [Pseudomonas sp. Marseille-Q8238]